MQIAKHIIAARDLETGERQDFQPGRPLPETHFNAAQLDELVRCGAAEVVAVAVGAETEPDLPAPPADADPAQKRKK